LIHSVRRLRPGSSCVSFVVLSRAPRTVLSRSLRGRVCVCLCGYAGKENRNIEKHDEKSVVWNEKKPSKQYQPLWRARLGSGFGWTTAQYCHCADQTPYLTTFSLPTHEENSTIVSHPKCGISWKNGRWRLETVNINLPETDLVCGARQQIQIALTFWHGETTVFFSCGLLRQKILCRIAGHCLGLKEGVGPLFTTGRWAWWSAM
jgi:hypothetical protein